MLLAALLILVVLGSSAFAVAGYYGARDANDKASEERADRILQGCRRSNATNRGVLNFINATLNTKPLVAPVTGDAKLDQAVKQILDEVNINSATRNDAIANAQQQYFPLINCETGKTIPITTTTAR
jgi:hypothetical protein